MNEWVTVRMRERAIYTTGRKVCSDLRRKFRHRAQDFRHTLETLYKRQTKSARKDSVGTPNIRRDFQRVSTAYGSRNYRRACEGEDTQSLGVGTSDACRDCGQVRAQDLASGVPTHVRTSDDHCLRVARQQFRPASGLPIPVVTEKVSKCL